MSILDPKYISNTYIQEKLAKLNRIGQEINAKAEEANTDNLNEVDCLHEKRELVHCFAAIAKELNEKIPDHV